MPENPETPLLIDQFNDSDDELIEEIVPLLLLLLLRKPLKVQSVYVPFLATTYMSLNS